MLENWLMTIIFVSSLLRWRYDLANVSYLPNYCEPNWKFRSSFAPGKFLVSLLAMMTPSSLSLRPPSALLWHKIISCRLPKNILKIRKYSIFSHKMMWTVLFMPITVTKDSARMKQACITCEYSDLFINMMWTVHILFRHLFVYILSGWAQSARNILWVLASR